MAAGKESQVASLTADTDVVLDQLETITERVEFHLHEDISDSFRREIKAWSTKRGVDDPFPVVARYAVLNVVLKATVCEWYAHRGDVPMRRGDLESAFEEAHSVTENSAFRETFLDEIVWCLPSDLVAELSWWRHGLLTTADPADDIGYLFEELIPAGERKTHGQFRTPPQISAIMRELAVSDGDSVLDAGMGAGALSVPREESGSARVFGIEQSQLGFLLAVTTLAVAGQRSVVHEADFFNVDPSTLGMDPDAAIGMGPDTGDVDIVPGQVDAVIGNPPYVANRDLTRETAFYRQHLYAFGAENRTPYLDGEKKLSGRSDLFVYFLTHATQFLTGGGRLVYLLPTKWMETQYGQDLQTFLYDHYKISAVIRFDDTVFDDAQVNAVILVADRCADPSTRRATTTRFITVNSKLQPNHIRDLVSDDANNFAVQEENEDGSSQQEADYRVVTVAQSELEDRDPSDGPLSRHFREPEALRSLNQNEVLVPLETLASVTHGKKTGNNELFLLSDSDLQEWPLADRFFRPALDDFGSVSSYDLTARASDAYLLDIHPYIASLDSQGEPGMSGESSPQRVKSTLARDGYDALVAYLEDWEETRQEALPDDDIWFDVGGLHAPDIVHPYRVHRTVRVLKNTDDVIPTNCANGIDVKPGVDVDALLGYLNSTVHAAQLELWGQSEGGGSLEVITGTLSRMPVADVAAFSEESLDAVKTAYQALVQGEDNAQLRLDRAVLNAINSEIDPASLREATETLTHNRLSTD